jgi:FHA domain
MEFLEARNMGTPPTKTITPADPAATFRPRDEIVVRFREWGTDQIHMLPDVAFETIAAPLESISIGASQRCKLRLIDTSHRVSREHAELSWQGSHWVLRDLGSKNGLWVDGQRCQTLSVRPGLEIGIGGLTLVAETAALIDLRCFLSRILGWANDRAIIDRALRAIRTARAQRTALMLVGPDDMVAIAHSIHRRTQGPSRPFVLCDPRRQPSEPSLHAPASRRFAAEALTAAIGGTLCLRADRLPSDFDVVGEALRDPSIPVQVVGCADHLDPRLHLMLATAPIIVPPLTERPLEIRNIVREYSGDATVMLATKQRLSNEDRAWVVANSASSLAEIERGTIRLLAIRISRSNNAAAELLGISHSSLFEWMQKRNLSSGPSPEA